MWVVHRGGIVYRWSLLLIYRNKSRLSVGIWNLLYFFASFFMERKTPKEPFQGEEETKVSSSP